MGPIKLEIIVPIELTEAEALTILRLFSRVDQTFDENKDDKQDVFRNLVEKKIFTSSNPQRDVRFWFSDFGILVAKQLKIFK